MANHVSWLDIIVLNAIHPSQFIAKSEVRDWPIIGWLCRRSGTIFIERAMRRNAAMINQRVSTLLKQGICIALFPEGTTTDGTQVGHFHSALIQPAIDAEKKLCPVALRYQNEKGEPSTAAAFIGDTTLAQSIWNILRSPQLSTLVMFSPALPTAKKIAVCWHVLLRQQSQKNYWALKSANHLSYLNLRLPYLRQYSPTNLLMSC